MAGLIARAGAGLVCGGALALGVAMLAGRLPDVPTGIALLDDAQAFITAARDVLGPPLAALMVVVFGCAAAALCLVASSIGSDAADGSGVGFGSDGCGGDGGD